MRSFLFSRRGRLPTLKFCCALFYGAAAGPLDFSPRPAFPPRLTLRPLVPKCRPQVSPLSPPTFPARLLAALVAYLHFLLGEFPPPALGFPIGATCTLCGGGVATTPLVLLFLCVGVLIVFFFVSLAD